MRPRMALTGISPAGSWAMPEPRHRSGPSPASPVGDKHIFAALTYYFSIAASRKLPCSRPLTQMFVWIFLRKNISQKSLLRFNDEKEKISHLSELLHTLLKVCQQVVMLFHMKDFNSDLACIEVKSSDMSYFIPLLYPFHTSCIQKIRNGKRYMFGNKKVFPYLAWGLHPKCCIDWRCQWKCITNDSSRNQVQNISEHYLNYTINCRIRNFLIRC